MLPGQETENKVVWPRLKVFSFSKDDPIGHAVKGRRIMGIQKKRWEDNIKEWTGMDFASSTRVAANTTKWKGIVANSSVVPQWPSKVMGSNRVEYMLSCF